MTWQLAIQNGKAKTISEVSKEVWKAERYGSLHLLRILKVPLVLIDTLGIEESPDSKRLSRRYLPTYLIGQIVVLYCTEMVAVGVDCEEAGEKWRAGDAQKSTRFFVRALEKYDAGLQQFPRSFDLAYNK